MSTRKHHHRLAISLRPAETKDIAAILELETACFARAEEMFNRRQVRGLIINPRAIAVVAESNGKMLGWAAGLLRRYRQQYSGRLYSISVHPDMQGKHIGKKLIGHVLHKLAVRGARRVFLEVHAENQKAINLYHKLGFIDQGYLANYYGTHHHGIRMLRPATTTQRPKSYSIQMA